SRLHVDGPGWWRGFADEQVYRLDQVVKLERLGDADVCSQTLGRLSRAIGGGHQHNGHGRQPRVESHALDETSSVKPRHHQIENDGLRRLGAVHELQRLRTVRCSLYPV